MIDEQINIALETRDNLVNQREILKVLKKHIGIGKITFYISFLAIVGSSNQVE